MSGYEALRSGVAWIDLSARGKIRVTGEDRARLLHAMSTNNVRDLGVGDGSYLFFLSAQGRILADAIVYNLGESLLLDTEPELRAKLREHLDRYIIADDAYLADESETLFAVGLEGPGSLEWAEEHEIPAPSKPYSNVPYQGGFVVRATSVTAQGLRIFVPIDESEKLLTLLIELPQATSGEAEIVRLENGQPRYGAEITERFLVQETGVLHAVHSNKGCYLGQEIVERVRSRAQVHRHLRSVGISTREPVAAGTKLYANGKDVGEIVSAAYSPAKQVTVGFAYVRTEGLGVQESITINEPGGFVSVSITPA